MEVNMKRALLSASPDHRIVSFNMHTGDTCDGVLTIGTLGGLLRQTELLFVTSFGAHSAMEKMTLSTPIDGIWGIEYDDINGVLIKFNSPPDFSDLIQIKEMNPNVAMSFSQLLNYRLDAPIDREIPEITDDGKTWIILGRRKLKSEYQFEQVIVI